MDKIIEIAERYNLIIVEDAAYALGSEYNGRKIGTLAHMTEFSFHPVKSINTGEGGIIVINDEKLYERLNLIRTHGITRNRDLMNNYEGTWCNEQIDLGYNYRITDLQCALGNNKISYLSVYLHPYYQQLGYEKGLFPEAEKLYTEIIKLLLFSKMSDSDVDDVTKAVNKVITYYKK